MAKPFRILCFVLLCLQCQTVTSMPPLVIAAAVSGIASAMFTIGKILVEDIVYLDRKWSDPAERGEFVERPIDLSESNILDQLRYLAEQRNQFMIDVANMKNDLIFEIQKKTPGLVELNRRLTEIFVKSGEVDIKYNKFVDYYNDSLHNSTSDDLRYNKELVLTFAQDAVSDNKCSLQHDLNEIHTLVATEHVSPLGTLNLLVTYVELIIEYAKVKQSPQQFIYNILISILYTQLKGYIALTFSFRILQKYNNGNYKRHLLDLDKDYSLKINETISIFKTAMAHAPREIWKNNPLKHEEDETFVELKNVFSQFFINVYDLRKDDSCMKVCSDYYYIYNTSTDSENCYYDLCKRQRKCNGNLHECKHQFDTKMTVCLENESSKRYRSLVVEPGMRYGSNKTCASTDAVPVEKAWMSYARWCHPCMCVCDEVFEPKSIRHFNLQPSISRFSDNYVMTGIRFKNHGTSIYLQIQEGQLLPNGRINESTIAWVPLNTSYTDAFSLHWTTTNDVILDDIEVPKDNALVGVRLWSESQDYGAMLRLKVMHVPINFTSGSVLSSEDYAEQNAFGTNSYIDIKDTNTPTGTSNQKVVRSTPGQVVEFTITGLIHDVGQSTIPFIDIQPVVADPPAPLAGAGIYHKAVPGTGGFLAPKLFTYDVEPHLQADISDGEDITSLKDTVDNQNIDEKILNHK